MLFKIFHQVAALHQEKERHVPCMVTLSKQREKKEKKEKQNKEKTVSGLCPLVHRVSSTPRKLIPIYP